MSEISTWEKVEVSAAIHLPQKIGFRFVRMRCGLPYIPEYAGAGWEVTCEDCLQTRKREGSKRE